MEPTVTETYDPMVKKDLVSTILEKKYLAPLLIYIPLLIIGILILFAQKTWITVLVYMCIIIIGAVYTLLMLKNKQASCPNSTTNM